MDTDEQPLVSYLRQLSPPPHELIGQLVDNYEFTFSNLFALSKDDLEKYYGLRGIFIYNHLHPTVVTPPARSISSSTSSSKKQSISIEMNTNSLLSFLDGQMKDKSRFNCEPHVLLPLDLSFPLVGREQALQKAANCMKIIAKPVTETDRIARKIPVCSGMSGLGKTRMLEEWQRIFDMADISPNRLGVFIAYYHGNSPHVTERNMTIEASFSWRLLHRCFILKNGLELPEWFTEILPNVANAGDLTLRLALKVIRQKTINLKMASEETLNLFIGVDEYQQIQNLGYGIKIGHEELLQNLLNTLGDLMASPVDGVRLFPMFAGTDLAMISIVNSSRTESIRMPMYLLSLAEVERAISLVPYGDRFLMQAPCRRHLFYIGGVPRWIAVYVFKLLENIKTLPEDVCFHSDTLEDAYVEVCDQYIRRWGKGLRSIDLIKLAAYSMSGVSVEESDTVINGMTWSRVRDSSICLINLSGEIMIPYAIYYRVSMLSPETFESQAVRSFISCLRSLIEDVDAKIYDTPSWNLWEIFGAYFHALRINAMIIVGRSVVKVKELFKGSILQGCEDEVRLKPMLVMKTDEKFSADTSSIISLMGHANEKHDWLKEGLVVVNGEGGEAIDIFYGLELIDSMNHVIILDQRKRVAGSDLGIRRVAALLQKIRSIDISSSLVNNKFIPALFSCMTSANVNSGDLVGDSIVVTYRQTQKYHGSLWIHPVASPFININKDPITYIVMLLTGQNKTEVARKILEKRKAAPFMSYSELEVFVKAQSQNLNVALHSDSEERITFC